jgi:hypothetical protein
MRWQNHLHREQFRRRLAWRLCVLTRRAAGSESMKAGRSPEKFALACRRARPRAAVSQLRVPRDWRAKRLRARRRCWSPPRAARAPARLPAPSFAGYRARWPPSTA